MPRDHLGDERIQIIGGGLAGCEAALQLADRGHKVALYEMRPARPTEAHRGDGLAELVCSNSFKSEAPDTSGAALKTELDLLGCRLLPLAREARVPGGAALALDRDVFTALVTEAVESHSNIELIREEVPTIPSSVDCIVATGPLTSPSLQQSIAERTGSDGLFFYDAIAPSVMLDSLDESKVYRASRYDKGEADYINCPFTRDEYEHFINELLAGDRVPMKDFEKAAYFQACMPIEVIADKGRESLRFGPMRPVGLHDPRTGERPWAVLQLRQETKAGTLFGLVGFQTQLKYGEQKRIFRLIPGLENAEFARLGSLHRNTFIDSPRILRPDLSLMADSRVWMAGQIIGCEGYVESLAMGLMAAISLHGRRAATEFSPPPMETMLGSLMGYLRDTTVERLSPMNVNFGLMPTLDPKPRGKRERRAAYVQRAAVEMERWVSQQPEVLGLPAPKI